MQAWTASFKYDWTETRTAVL